MYDHLIETVKGYNPAAGFDQIHAAYEYAAAHHAGQNRKDGSPFITHPLAVAQIVAEELHLDTESIVAALLHDTIEDTSATHEEISKLFSPTVADLVEGVSKLTRVHYTSKEEEQMENLRKMLIAMAKDIRVILIKISDRLHNMRTMEYQTPEKQKQKSFETMEIYAPIAHRLGMQKLKWELEDLSLRYLDPVGYKEIEEELAERSSAHEEFMAGIQHKIQQRLAQEGIHATVYGRVKHIYSIYRKMYTQNKTLDEIFDLYAFRVIVDDIPGCYNVLGCIHDMFKPVLGRFKDYIGTPKPNMYQSLHTTVIGHEGIPFEVQIRTRKMDEMAEYGVAAHWKYKEGLDGHDKLDERLAWVSQLLENQRVSEDSGNLLHDLKSDLLPEEVFAFTPKGDVISMPKGATPLDFAYRIHSAVGNKCVGSKINGRIMPLDTPLETGDRVEIITSASSKGPSADWVRICKTPQAQAKIRAFLKKEYREENIETGRAMVERECRRRGLNPPDVIKPEYYDSILKKYGFTALNDIYSAVGYGGMASVYVVSRLVDEQRTQTAQAAPKAEELLALTEENQPQRKASGKANHGIILPGNEDMDIPVRFGKCCSPVPGDDIVGFITRGYGVSVHRADCPNAAPERRRPEEAGRWVKVSWGKDVKQSYQTSLDIYAKDRIDLVLDVSAVLSSTQTRVAGLNAKTTADGFALIHLEIFVADSEQLSAVMRRLHQISGVMKVDRPAG